MSFFCQPIPQNPKKFYNRKFYYKILSATNMIYKKPLQLFSLKSDFNAYFLRGPRALRRLAAAFALNTARHQMPHPGIVRCGKFFGSLLLGRHL